MPCDIIVRCNITSEIKSFNISTNNELYSLAGKPAFTLAALPVFNPFHYGWQLWNLGYFSAVFVLGMVGKAGLSGKIGSTSRADKGPLKGVLPQMLA